MLDRLEAERPPRAPPRLPRRRTNASGSRGNCTTRSARRLTVALLSLKRAVDRAPAEIRDELHDTQETVRAGLDEVRSIARRLRPDALEDLGLHSALNALCTEFAQAQRNRRRQRHCAASQIALQPDVELVCYRIAQESLTNIARHAQASKVWLDSAQPRRISCGCASPTTARGGVDTEGAGINGMRERALLVSAALTIASPAGEGTEVLVDRSRSTEDAT